MTRRKALTDAGVKALKPRPTRYTVPDPDLRGHYVRIMPTGAKSFVALARTPDGKQVWATLGGADLLSIGDAREKARAAIQRIKAGLPAVAERAKVETFGDVADNFTRRWVVAKGLRSKDEIERILARYILPEWRDREFTSIRRSDVAALLDTIEDANGPRQADYALAIIRKLMNWYASRDEDYDPPIARGMHRGDPAASKRARTLDDDEIRTVWQAAGDAGRFGALLRLALLTAQRREALATMRWEDISDEGVWAMPTEARQKGVGGALQLPPAALEIIRAQPQLADNPYVFAGRKETHFNGWSKAKAALDKVAPIASWRVHDLRRTARSLMARAGVRPDIAERVMGHAITGVEGVYDRYSYAAEKGEALASLASILAAILNPTAASNVVSLPQKESA